MAQIMVACPAEMKRQFKAVAAAHGYTTKQLITGWVRTYLRKNAIIVDDEQGDVTPGARYDILTPYGQDKAAQQLSRYFEENA